MFIQFLSIKIKNYIANMYIGTIFVEQTTMVINTPTNLFNTQVKSIPTCCPYLQMRSTPVDPKFTLQSLCTIFQKPSSNSSLYSNKVHTC